MSASIKITLYSDEGPTPSITSISSSQQEEVQIEWAALVGTAKHLLRNHEARLPELQRAALVALVATQGEP